VRRHTIHAAAVDHDGGRTRGQRAFKGGLEVLLQVGVRDPGVRPATERTHENAGQWVTAPATCMQARGPRTCPFHCGERSTCEGAAAGDTGIDASAAGTSAARATNGLTRRSAWPWRH